MTRRERLLKFINNFYASYERGGWIGQGYGRSGVALDFEDLTDAALERLAARLRVEYWQHKGMCRRNRAAMRERERV